MNEPSPTELRGDGSKVVLDARAGNSAPMLRDRPVGTTACPSGEAGSLTKKPVGVIPALAAGDFFGVIIFIVIAIVSLLGKMQEAKKKKGDWEKPLDSPSVEPEDLPEPIRRMLYGDREESVRTAKPAHPEQVQQPAPRTAVPSARPATPRAQQTQPRQRPVTIAPQPARSPQSQTVRQVVVQKPAQPTARPTYDETRPSYDDETRPRMQPLLQKPAPPKVVKAVVPPVPKPAMPKVVKPPTPEVLVRAALASDAAVQPIANPWRFKDKTDLRRAIVLSEILSPPLALRE